MGLINLNTIVGQKLIKRINYVPYSMKDAKWIWHNLMIELTGKKEIVYTDENKMLYENLIKWAQGDESSIYNLEKSFFINGKTGPGKTTAMLCLNGFLSQECSFNGQKINGFKCFKNNNITNLYFQVFNSRDIVNAYMSNGAESLNRFMYYDCILIDDFGAEPKTSQYYGTSTNVLSDIIERRYDRNNITHFTSNLPIASIKEIYGDRVYSRIYETCNIITLKGNDLRLTNE